ncbi:hypothetical protein [Cupriavidus pauculus]|uniref:hypothetical protein n=1 Tax=Cupriavidus pauculus TaxID=82633 RepID=UPI001EE1CE01|nr:hypothetical protein [Cupriavidus pauculus]GJG97735.1 hypothetical protein CBA19C6_24620 [Cupriavidus pauculus]
MRFEFSVQDLRGQLVVPGSQHDQESIHRCYDYTEHAMWQSCEGKAWQIKDSLPAYAVDVWTYFSGWASLKHAKPPMFRTTVSGSLSKCFESETWEQAKDKHRRVLEKVRATLPRCESIGC